MVFNYLAVLANFWLMREVLSHVGCYHFDLTMEWLTLSLICFPFQVHLTPLANMDRLNCFISFVECACLPYWYSVLTFQQPTQMCCFGVRWSTIGLLTVIISGVLMACNTTSPSWSIVVVFCRFRCVCGFYRVGLLALRLTLLLSYLVLGSVIAEFELRWAKKYCRVFLSSRSYNRFLSVVRRWRHAIT